MKIELKIPTMEDKDGLKAVCNAVDRKYLSDRLPYPYTDESAEWWINMVAENDGKTGIWRVIYVDGKPYAEETKFFDNYFEDAKRECDLLRREYILMRARQEKKVNIVY